MIRSVEPLLARVPGNPLILKGFLGTLCFQDLDAELVTGNLSNMTYKVQSTHTVR